MPTFIEKQERLIDKFNKQEKYDVEIQIEIQSEKQNELEKNE